MADLRRLELPFAVMTVSVQLGLIAVQIALPEIGRAHHPFSDSTLLADASGSVGSVLFPALGLLLVARRAGNRMGWLFILAYLGWGLSNAATVYVEFATSAGPLPAVPLAIWLTTWPGSASTIPLVLLIVLFPDGRAPSRRWRHVAEAAVVVGIATCLLAAFAPGPTQSFQVAGLAIDNPLGLDGPLGPFLGGIANVAPLASVGLLALAAVSMVRRLTRSTGLERQQLKWLAYAVVVAACLWIADVPIMVVYTSLKDAPDWARLANSLSTASGGLIPVGAGIAILRYRLYDIDRVISRTLAYAALTVLLAAAYAAGFLVLEAALAPFTTGGGPIAVAASTLAVFALFAPVRRRTQAAVDRRFNRRRYDAAREVDAFAARIRDEVEVERLAVALERTLERTMQPATASVWLGAGRPAGGGR